MFSIPLSPPCGSINHTNMLDCQHGYSFSPGQSFKKYIYSDACGLKTGKCIFSKDILGTQGRSMFSIPLSPPCGSINHTNMLDCQHGYSFSPGQTFKKYIYSDACGLKTGKCIFSKDVLGTQGRSMFSIPLSPSCGSINHTNMLDCQHGYSFSPGQSFKKYIYSDACGLKTGKCIFSKDVLGTQGRSMFSIPLSPPCGSINHTNMLDCQHGYSFSPGQSFKKYIYSDACGLKTGKCIFSKDVLGTQGRSMFSIPLSPSCGSINHTNMLDCQHGYSFSPGQSFKKYIYSDACGLKTGKWIFFKDVLGTQGRSIFFCTSNATLWINKPH